MPRNLLSLFILVLLLSACGVEIAPTESNDILEDDGNAVLAAAQPDAAQPDQTSTDTGTATGADSAIVLDPETDVSIDFGNDGLIAPEAPELQLTTKTGAIAFSWNTPTANAQPALYEYDQRTQIETLIDANIDLGARSYDHPITPHQLAWEHISYRVELCTVDNCVSSSRVSPTAIADSSTLIFTRALTKTSPNEQAAAVSGNGLIIAVADAIDGELSIYFKLPEAWTLGSRIALPDGFIGSDITLRLSLSGSGDTIALAKASLLQTPQVAIFERFGENWIETATVASTLNNSAQRWDSQSLQLQLAEEADRLLISVLNNNNSSIVNASNNQHILQLIERNNQGWQVTDHIPQTQNSQRLPAITTNAALTSVVYASITEQQLYLHTVDYQNSWQERGFVVLPMLQATHDITLDSNSAGSELAVAGWEASSLSQATAVVWRVQKVASEPQVNWVTRDSIRLPSVQALQASLHMSAGDELRHLAINVQSSQGGQLALYSQNQTGWQHNATIIDNNKMSAEEFKSMPVHMSTDGDTLLLRNGGSNGIAPYVQVFR